MEFHTSHYTLLSQWDQSDTGQHVQGPAGGAVLWEASGNGHNVERKLAQWARESAHVTHTLRHITAVIHLCLRRY